MSCERCGCDEQDGSIHDIELLGEAYASLCNPCRTAWTAFSASHELQDRTNRLCAMRWYLDVLAGAGNPATIKDYVDHLTEKDRLILAWNAVAREWLAAGPGGA